MISDFTEETTYGKTPGICSRADMISSLAACADAVLIQMAIAGRNDCFSLLMDRHLTAVKRRLRFMVSNEADLDDVVQEIQLKAWLHLKTFRLESNLRTWMIRIAINEACQLYRRGKRGRLCEPLDEAVAFLEESADQRLQRAEAAATLRCALAKLPRKYQEVVMLRDLCELGGEETAKRLHTTIPTIKTRLFRARLMLSTELRRLGILSLAALVG
ncbi:MAG TPA: RNA polymerase sigma factor [Bryobacteraceae bacterium]|nr:RNA polymerase sigma factor [Bryobacteraceae bacterium]